MHASPPRTEGQSALRRINTTVVLRALQGAKAPQRATDVATTAGLTRPTVMTILASLMEQGLVEEASSITSGGRPAPTYRLAPLACPVVGVDVGPRRIAARVCSLDGSELSTEQSRDVPQGNRLFLDGLAALVERAASGANVPVHRLAALCLATPGIVNAERMVESRPFERWVQSDLALGLAGRLGVPVGLENDANAAALALREHQGFPPSYIAVQWGRRLGAGVVLNGALHRGHGGTAGEIGGLIMAGAPEDLEQRVSTDLFLDPTVGTADPAGLARAVELVADALAPACGMLGVRRIILSGGCTHAGRALTDCLAAALARRGMIGAQCTPSPYGEDTILVGASVAARDNAWNGLLSTSTALNS